MDTRKQAAASSRSLRIVVVDDHPLMLEGIASILRGSPHETVALLAEAGDLLPLLEAKRVDAVTLDIGMPKLNGIDLAKKIKLKYPALKIIFITQQTDRTYIRSAMDAEASAFVAKHRAGSELLDALSAVASNRKYVSPGLLETQGSLQITLDDLQKRTGRALSPRQREVLQLIAEGKTVKEIASTLAISTKTVEFHKQALGTNLGLRTTAEFTRYAIACGLIFL